MFPVIEAPQWHKGYIVNFCFIVGCWFTLSLGFFLYRREEKANDRLVREDPDAVKDEVKHLES